MDPLDLTNVDPTRPVQPSGAVEAAPRQLGRYRLLRPVGEGGMGTVYLAYDGTEQRQVALKVLADSLAHNPSYVNRFYREARNGCHLNHPHIVRCYGAGQDPETHKHYLVMEYVDGPTAHCLLQQHERFSVPDAVHVALALARALEHAHSRSIVHRDVKPDNILFTRSGVAKLADLGLAKRTDEASHLTATRQGFGTPHYMPYEQAMDAKHADGRSDIYALGATLYHLVTGEVPFPGANHLEVVEKKGIGHFLPASHFNPEVPPAMDRVLSIMLAREPAHRYQNACELAIDLERTGLAAPVLSFADQDLARQDPDAWSNRAAFAIPTALDISAGATPAEIPPEQLPAALRIVKSAAAKAAPETAWRLRYRGADGHWRGAQATAEQIRACRAQGRLPEGVQAARPGSEHYQPLDDYPEFGDGRKASQAEPATARHGRWHGLFPIVAATALAALLLGGGAALLWLVLNHR